MCLNSHGAETVLPGVPLYRLERVPLGCFTALGNGLVPALISSLRSLILVTAFILILPRIIGVSGIWLTMPLAEAVTIFIALYLYRAHGKAYLRDGGAPA